ncbi:hypothetical protein Halru_1868 [Halovivax ruber XH-70]|uniref:Uncharacterized protein n=1 Tax=Halovivax ruber (strain DSM 18193 / JCM 13892 / XH-70) TaxID=797302 RepID=L0IES5_HALRX|nr:hypothetical protein [Halovivax ruber]AGB16467.1 hypothetical protein Halru_1868 [Halovivax ruber XH-70]
MSGFDTTVRRRELLGVAGSATLAGLAGCTALVDWIGDKVLGDVNIFNETTERVTGTIVVTDSDGTDVLDASFDAPPADEDEGDDSQPDEGNTSTEASEDTQVFEDVWDGPGRYEVRVELDEDQTVGDDATASTSVEISDPDEEMLAVVLGASDFDAGIGFATGDALSEFQDNPIERTDNESESGR